MVKVEAMRTLVAVVEAGSIAPAARHLGRTPAAVSMTLKQIETDVGGALFDANRKSRLTPLGVVVLRNARRAVDAHDAAVNDIGQYARGKKGSIKIASTPSIARRVLPFVMTRLLADRPELHVEIRDVDSLTVAELTAAGTVDLGIGSPSAASRELEATFLREDPFWLICRRDHPLAGAGREVAWADLAGHGFIPNGLCDTMALDPVIRLSATARLRARNVAALYGLVEAGLGVTILPTLAAPTEGTLTMVPLVDREATTRIYVFRRKDEVLSPAADRLRTMLLAGL